MLVLRDVTKIYDGSKFALDNVSIIFERTGLHAITGKSGAGKSTLLNIIFLLESVQEGKVIINDIFLSDLKGKNKDKYRGNLFSFVFQEYNLIEDMTVKENLELCVSKNKQDEERIKLILDQVGLKGYKNKEVKKLSGGERQRVAIARALVKNTKIILADEPTGSLDNETGESIMELLKTVSKDHLVILVTHNLEYVEKYADRIIKLESGRVVEDEVIHRTEILDMNYYFKKKKNDFQVVKKFFLANFSSSKLKTFYTVLLFSVFMLISLLFTGFLFIDSDKAYTNQIKDNEYRFLKISYDGRQKFGYYKYNQLDEKVQSLSLPYIDSNISIKHTPINELFIIGNNSNFKYQVNYKEILLTDYVADLMILYYPNIKTRQDIIGQDFIVNDHVLKISGIVDTVYKDDENMLNRENYYATAFINSATLEYIYSMPDICLDLLVNDEFFPKVQFVLDETLLDNKLLVSHDLVSKISENNISMLIDHRNFQEAAALDFNIQGEIPDTNIKNTIYISKEYMDELSYIYKALHTDFKYVSSMNGEYFHAPGYDHHTFIIDDSLTGNQVKMSSDLTSFYPIEKLQVVFENDFTLSPFLTEFDSMGVISDNNVTNTFYISEEMYQQLFYYNLGGGAVITVNNESLELIPKLYKEQVYFDTLNLEAYIELNNVMKIAYIPLLILTIASFTLLIILFRSFLYQRIEMRKRDYILLKCLGNDSTIKKIIFCEIAFIMFLSLITSVVLFLLISLPVNAVLGNFFFKQVNIELLITIIITMSLAIFTSFYIEITFLKKIDRTRELDIIK